MQQCAGKYLASASKDEKKKKIWVIAIPKLFDANISFTADLKHLSNIKQFTKFLKM